jgi:hypothetical protein
VNIGVIMTSKELYAEKLKDPRWQKMRLSILDRDEWKCVKCHDENSTLHIHHRYYEWNKDPWSYRPETLVTLCEECHAEETELLKRESARLSNEIKMRLDSSGMSELVCGMQHVLFGKESKEFFSAVSVAMEFKHVRDALMTAYKEFMAHKCSRTPNASIFND